MISSRADREPLVQPGSIEHHVADLSATFAADVTLGAAQAKLRENNQWLPIDGDSNATLGELVERNSTGPLRLGFGAWRDLLLGAQFRNGDGELITAGGRTVKNVAGYDLTKFMVGQFGIFGKLVTITTRTYKRVEFALLVAFDPDVKKLNTLLVTPCRPAWAALTRDALLCGFLGDARAAEFYEKNLPQYQTHELIRHSLDDDIAARAKLWRSNLVEQTFLSASDVGTPTSEIGSMTTQTIDKNVYLAGKQECRPHQRNNDRMSFRAAIAPSRIVEFTRSIDTTDCVADAAFGVVIGSCSSESQDSLHKAASIARGTVVIFDSTGRPQNLSLDPGISSLLRRLKLSFDSHGNLNPLPLAAS